MNKARVPVGHEPWRVGIYGLSSQSGKAYLADLLEAPGISVYGYTRDTEHGIQTVEAIRSQHGIFLERPPDNPIGERSRFVSLGANEIGHDLDRLVETSDLIIFTHPSVFHETSVAEIKESLGRRRIPLVLSPSRTLATPYLWQMLGEHYPILAFQTCPYSCKSYSPGTTYIKTRKKNCIASIEGDVSPEVQQAFLGLFPQTVYSRVPATTSLGNIGAVFHPTPYVLNLDAIRAARARGEQFAFYTEGIAHNAEVGAWLEDIDQIRLRIAQEVGCQVLGLHEAPNEGAFLALLQKIQRLEQTFRGNWRELRKQSAVYLQAMSDFVVSSQLWLAYTYGVQRIPQESLASAIGRTSTFQRRSVPQDRYAEEDIPTGLVPLEALAQRLGIPHTPISLVIDRYERITGKNFRHSGRNLASFDIRDLKRYLCGQRH